MATGDIGFYTKFLWAQFDGDANGALSNTPVDFDADTIQVAVMKPAFTPDLSHDSAQEHWDNVVGNQVSLGTAYTGPITIATDDVTASGTTVTYDGADITISQDAGTGFTDGRRIVFLKWDTSATVSPLIATGDLGSSRANTTGSLTFSWNSNGIYTVS